MKPLAARPRVLVVGSINTDLVARVKNLPQRGETIQATGFSRHLGGKGANQAVAAAMLGADVKMVGCIGDDAEGILALQELDAAKVDRSQVHPVRGVPTGTALITVDPQGENTIVVVPGANQELESSHVETMQGELATYSAVIVQLEIPDEIVLSTVKAVNNARTPPPATNGNSGYDARVGNTANPLLVFNPSPFRPSALPPPGSIDLLIVNELEAEAMCGTPVEGPSDAVQAARQLLPELRAGGCVVITLGNQGAVALPDLPQEPSSTGVPARGNVLHIPALSVKAVDTTGAGDVFTGALVTQLCSGRPLSESLRFATVAAAITVTRLGAQSSFPRLNEITRMLSRVEEARRIQN